jgi:hypothetical protein
MERRTLITLFLVGLLVPVGFATAGGLLTDAEPASGDVAIGASDGPTVVVTGINNKIELTEFTPDSNTVKVASDAGNGTFSSNGYTHVRADNIEGTWTNLSALNVTGATLTVDPIDKEQASISGDADTFEYRDTMQVDDGTIDFTYSGTSGTTTVTVRGVPANANIGAVDETGTLLATATSNANGVVTLSGMANSEHNVSLTEGTRPEVSNLQPDKNLSTAPSELSVDITDKDFANGDSVTVEFTLDGSVIDTQTVSSNGTVTTPLPSSGESLGEHTWSVNATDDYGLTDTGSASYGIPNQLRFVNESDGTLLDTITIEATFFDGNITTITTSDGTINMTGLDATDEFTVDAKPQSLYFDRTVYIVSIVDQRTVYLLRDNQSIVPSVTNRFTLRDRTGNFDGNGARLKIQKAINVSGTSEWQTIHGDEFGVSGVQTQLEKGVRYRLIVTNNDKDTRVLGTYVAEANETVPLTIGTVQGDPVAGSDGFRYNATYDNSTGTPTVRFTYNDTNVSTSELSLTIYQKGNESNVLFRNQTFTNGPYGSISVSEMVPANQSQNTWIVEAYVQRNGEQQKIREQVGPRNAVLLAIPNWLKVFISVGSIWLVAGLFSRLNGHIGGLVVAGMGGMWWFVDFLPAETGIGVVVLSLITAGILFIKERAAI